MLSVSEPVWWVNRLTHAPSDSCGNNRMPATRSRMAVHRFQTEIKMRDLSQLQIDWSKMAFIYRQTLRPRLQNNCEFLEIAKLFHGGHTLFGTMDLLLDAMVTLLSLLALVIQSTDPAGALSVVQNLAMRWLIISHDNTSHERHWHNINKCSVQRENEKTKKWLESAHNNAVQQLFASIDPKSNRNGNRVRVACAVRNEMVRTNNRRADE